MSRICVMLGNGAGTRWPRLLTLDNPSFASRKELRVCLPGLIQVGIRPDRRARGMLHISGGSEWGVAESGGEVPTLPLLGVTPVGGA